MHLQLLTCHELGSRYLWFMTPDLSIILHTLNMLCSSSPALITISSSIALVVVCVITTDCVHKN